MPTPLAGCLSTSTTPLSMAAFAEGDQLVRIENVTGSQYNDGIVGNAGVNTLDGQKGNDKIYGGDGDDKRLGGDGNDALSGDAGKDILHGDAGNDILAGGAGADQFFGDKGDDVMHGGADAVAYDGGDGVDTVDYSAAPAVAPVFGFTGVFVNLAAGVGAVGDADGDTYVNVENVRGSAYIDGIQGDSHDNDLRGNGGDDFIAGGGGADRLDGGDGIDTLSYVTPLTGPGAATVGVNVDLLSNQASGGHATGDTILNFENVFGSNLGDTLVGTNDSNEIHGGGGGDTLVGRGGADRIEGDAGNDFMIGGSETDTFVFIAANTTPGTQQGNDIIGDFVVGTDHLEFHGGVVNSVRDLQFITNGPDTIIRYDDGSNQASITLVNVGHGATGAPRPDRLPVHVRSAE